MSLFMYFISEDTSEVIPSSTYNRETRYKDFNPQPDRCCLTMRRSIVANQMGRGDSMDLSDEKDYLIQNTHLQLNLTSPISGLVFILSCLKPEQKNQHVLFGHTSYQVDILYSFPSQDTESQPSDAKLTPLNAQRVPWTLPVFNRTTETNNEAQTDIPKLFSLRCTATSAMYYSGQ